MGQTLLCGRFELSLERPLIMGVVNVTPDSFADDAGGYFSIDAAIARAHELVAQGADILDIGGESTRPGADPVSEDEERRRVMPVIEALREAGVPLSVDTFKAATMRSVLDAGADMINDISGFRDAQAVRAVVGARCALCVMHMQGEPRTMQDNPHYKDVAADIRSFLTARCNALRAAGVQRSRIVVDPGFGFGKTLAQNYELLGNLREACGTEFPCLVGLSRKSMIGHITGREPAQRVAGSIAAALAALARGAHILRVHDVQETLDAVRVWRAVEYGVA